ncbi:MAG: M48 family metallopeptidase [Deltaproteobacteria bacterium]|nr:M48 family metallopeptidase [Deltaproteobacteria bacterium]
MTAQVDLDFARYVAIRRGMAAQRARDGSAYAFSSDRKVTQALSSTRPVLLATQATVRLWKTRARAEILRSAVKVTDQQFPRLHDIGARCAEILRIPSPTLHVSRSLGEIGACTLGTDEEALVFVHPALVDRLSDQELSFVVGHELGHVQNNHVVFATALHYLTAGAAFYVRWIVQPALLALRSWSRRAEITCDRAGLLCCGNLDVALRALGMMTLPPDRLLKDIDRVDDARQEQSEARKGLGRVGEIFHSHPSLAVRTEALKLFARGAFFQRFVGLDPQGALGPDDCDAQVASMVSVF